LKVAVLFSGNAASVYCHHQIREAGLDVVYLVTARSHHPSRMNQSLDPDLTRLSARSLAIPLIEFVADEEDTSPLIEALAGLEIDGLCDGAVRSNRRRNRLVEVCQKLKIQLFLPLWHKDPREILADMIEEGFVIMITLKSDRLDLDGSWHGRVLDGENKDEFLQACDENGIDPMGESGEFDPIVLAGPSMRGRMKVSPSLLPHQSP